MRHDLDGNPSELGAVGPFDFRRVVSTDSVEGDYGDEVRVVRLLSVDAPAGGECYYEEALAWLDAWMSDFGIGLGIRVPPGRGGFGEEPVEAELVAVEAFESTHDLGSVNVAMVRAGAARWTGPDTSGEPLDGRFEERMEAAENDARASQRGLWNACVESEPTTTSSVQ